MKNLIIPAILMFTLTATAKTLECHSELISEQEKAEKKEPEKQSFKFELDKKNNLIVMDKKIESDCHPFTFGVAVTKGKIDKMWAMNTEGRGSSYDDKINATSYEHKHSSDGANLIVNCSIKD